MTPPETPAAFPQHPDALPEGTRIGDYEVASVLSASDAGIRYRCRDGDDPVALLECFPSALVRRREQGVLPHTATSARAFEAMLEQFLRDAENAASFRHPGVVPLHRTVRANGTVYAVMDYVEGETLASYLAREGSFPADRLEALTNGLLATLGALHGASLLHLGVEPGEIVVTGDDKAVVLATTLVRRSAGGARHSFAEARQQQRTMFVTSPYAAIELYAKGGQIGPWSDIYGLAASLYHCVTGAVPPAALDRLLHDELAALSPPAEEGYPAGILAAIDAGLGVQPDQRPRSVDGWRVITHGREGASPARPSQIGARGGTSTARARGGRRPRWALAALALVAITAVISYVDTGVLRGGDGADTVAVSDPVEGGQTPLPASDDAAPRPPANAAAPGVPSPGQPGDEAVGETASVAQAAERRAETERPGAEAAGEEAAAGAEAIPDAVADAAPPAADPPEEETIPAETVAEAPRAPAGLLVETVPTGVEVWIGDERVGRTPLQIEGLAPGVRDISLRHPLHRTMNLPQQEFLPGRQLQIDRRLARATGNLSLTTEPPGAWVAWRGDRIAETTPATLEGLPAGPLELTVGAPGFRTETVAAEIPRDRTGELTWALTQAFGTLTLELSPADATAMVLDEDGRRPYAAGMELPEGVHRVEVRRDGFLPRTTGVAVEGDTRLAIALERQQPCRLSVRGTPPAASYPVVRTFGGAGLNLGNASMFVSFTIEEDGTVAEDDVAVDLERSMLDRPERLDVFSAAAMDAVRRYQFDFEDGAAACAKRQRASLVIRFMAAPES